MRWTFLYISVILGFTTIAQDVNFGVNIGINPYSRLKLQSNTDWFQPANTFAIYQAEEAGSGLIIDEQQFFNTVHFGASLRASRKKIGINLEPQFLLEYMTFSLNTQFPNFNRVLSQRGLRVPLYMTYHLFNNPTSIHFNAGFIIEFLQVNDYQRPELDFYTTNVQAFYSDINHGDNHFDGVFYKREESQLNYMLGVGRRFNKLDYNLRYVTALNQNNLTGTRWQIELHINFFFLSKEEFTTKKYLYEE